MALAAAFERLAETSANKTQSRQSCPHRKREPKHQISDRPKALSGAGFGASFLILRLPRNTTCQQTRASAAPQHAFAATIGLVPFGLPSKREERLDPELFVSPQGVRQQLNVNTTKGGQFAHTVRAIARQPRSCGIAPRSSQDSRAQSQRGRDSRLPNRRTLVLPRL